MKNEKKNDDIFFNICFRIFVLAVMALPVSVIFKGIKKIIIDIIDLIKCFREDPFLATFCMLTTFIIIYIINYIINNWDKRDDFFYFIASILSSPSEYIYKKKKNKLLNYHNEIRELVDSINYFSNIDSNNFSKKDLLKFEDDVAKQHERLEKNRESLEKQNDKINIIVQIFILCLGIITSLFL